MCQGEGEFEGGEVNPKTAMNQIFGGFTLGIIVAFLLLAFQGLYFAIKDSVNWCLSDHWEMVSWDNNGSKWRNTISGRIVTNSPHHWPAEHKRTPIL